ncbi:MAG: CTP synthase (glutamine hydrolyzing) [Candidatus Woesearchaeota archaeon]|nr:MAG: CTP synthase (glutamine hydrolyzing) [Candidatus Woesearchaeota archaeon]
MKFIVVTGGVLSGLGKGIAAASIGHLISKDLKVTPIKLDGYLNVDPGTMNPIEHGEVFVLDDGGEVDMDFGHYERFLNISCKTKWNLTMGKVFNEIREKERRGDYLGKTVQFIPHVTNLIKSKFFEIGKEENTDIVLIEVGGTVGDIENELFLEAVRQLKIDVGSENIMYMHLTYVPIPHGVNEQKSKPTQQSVNMLRQKGINPDILICRCKEYLTEKTKERISIFCGVDKEAIITGLDVENVYEIPVVFNEEGIVNIINKKLKLNITPRIEWLPLLKQNKNSKTNINIAICGKYTKLEDSYASVIEAIDHAAANLKCKINLKWIETTDIEEGKISVEEALKDINGLIIPGGFGLRGAEGKIAVIKYAREKNIPFLGLCFGLQLAVVEFARNVCKLEGANSTEINQRTSHPVIDILPEQKSIINKGGTMRLGSYKAILKDGVIKQLYKNEKVYERHRHRYEVNPNYHEILANNGLVLSGLSEDGRLVEFIEYPKHKFFTATQAHPELKSSLINPSPLFYGLIKSCLE